MKAKQKQQNLVLLTLSLVGESSPHRLRRYVERISDGFPTELVANALQELEYRGFVTLASSARKTWLVNARGTEYIEKFLTGE